MIGAMSKDLEEDACNSEEDVDSDELENDSDEEEVVRGY